MNQQRDPPVFQSPGQTSTAEAAVIYLRRGWSVIPLRGKCPTVCWRPFQHTHASEAQVRKWQRQSLLHNIGIVCGAVSQQLVVLDIDSEVGFMAFATAFPGLVDTYTIRTGSGVGRHLYWSVERLPTTVRLRSPSLGGIELLAQGCQVVAPPSVHPLTQHAYQVERPSQLLRLAQVDTVETWLRQLRDRQSRVYPPSSRTPPKRVPLPTTNTTRTALKDYFERCHYQTRGDWLNGRCVFPQRHRHGDMHPSFGFNTRSGYGHCFVCGSIPPDDLCLALGICM